MSKLHQILINLLLFFIIIMKKVKIKIKSGKEVTGPDRCRRRMYHAKASLLLLLLL